MLLWELPEVLQCPFLYLEFLDHIRTEKHWLWAGLLNSIGGSDLLLDRLFLYIQPLPVRSCARQIEARLIAVDIFSQVFVQRAVADDRFAELFDSVLRRLCFIIEFRSPIELQIHSFRSSVRILQSMRYKFNDEAHLFYWSLLADSALKHPMIRPMFLRLMQTTLRGDLPVSKLDRILQNRPDHNDVWAVANLVAEDYSKAAEKPFAFVQALIVMAVTDEILARTSCRALALVIKSFDCQIAWLRAFLKKLPGFVIASQQRHLQREKVGLVFEFLTHLYETQIGWLQSEISAQAAILLASQTVPMVVVNALKPAARSETVDVNKIETDGAKIMELGALLMSVMDESVTKLPCAVLKGVGPQRRVAPVGCASLPNFPPIRNVMSQRNRGKAPPAKPAVKATRFPHLSVRH
jgi:hypothetical protein